MQQKMNVQAKILFQVFPPEFYLNFSGKKGYRFYICIIPFSRDLFYEGIVVFDLTYEEEWLDSVWSTLKPPTNFDSSYSFIVRGARLDL